MSLQLGMVVGPNKMGYVLESLLGFQSEFPASDADFLLSLLSGGD